MVSRKIVIVNQAVNYLTVGIANAFADKFEAVELITGSIHIQGDELNPSVKVLILINGLRDLQKRNLYHI